MARGRDGEREREQLIEIYEAGVSSTHNAAFPPMNGRFVTFVLDCTVYRCTDNNHYVHVKISWCACCARE